MTTALIHLNVPAPLKGRWVRASRAAGMRLSDWIVQHVERSQLTTLRAACAKHPRARRDLVGDVAALGDHGASGPG
mgnify:CR=1 FL=1